MEEQECRTVSSPHCQDVTQEECRDVPQLKMENQCTTTQEEKCINTTSHRMVTQQKTLVERICSDVPDQECQIQTIVQVMISISYKLNNSLNGKLLSTFK